MKIPEEWVDPNIRYVTAVYPNSYRCSDSNGYYIVNTDDHAEIGRAKKPAKAWKDAAQRIIKQRKKGKLEGADIPGCNSPRKKKA